MDNVYSRDMTTEQHHGTNWFYAQKKADPKISLLVFNGAGNEIRTRDVNLGKVALYHWVIPAQKARRDERMYV